MLRASFMLATIPAAIFAVAGSSQPPPLPVKPVQTEGVRMIRMDSQTFRARWRPLKVLIPMIQSELQQGDSAGREHYRRAGEMLIEAKDQVGHGGFSRWLTKNFDLSLRTAQAYMQWARTHNEMRSPASHLFALKHRHC